MDHAMMTWCFPRCITSKQWLPLPHLDHPPGCLCIARRSLFPGPRWPRSCTNLWCGMSRARGRGCVFTLLGLGSTVRCHLRSLSALFVGKMVPAHSSRLESRLLCPSICPSNSPSSQGGLSSPHWTPGLGCPVCDLTGSLPRETVWSSM